ncbi:hypothetical protein L0F63_007148, partial [Massospora cicadina]
ATSGLRGLVELVQVWPDGVVGDLNELFKLLALSFRGPSHRHPLSRAHLKPAAVYFNMGQGWVDASTGVRVTACNLGCLTSKTDFEIDFTTGMGSVSELTGEERPQARAEDPTESRPAPVTLAAEPIPLASSNIDMPAPGGSLSTTPNGNGHPESVAKRSSAQIDYIQELLQKMSADDRSHLPLSQLSPRQLESETMLTSMIDDIHDRLSGLARPKDKALRLTLQTLKSALVAERSQLQAARTDPLVLHDDDDQDQEQVLAIEPPFDETIYASPGSSPTTQPGLKERLALAMVPTTDVEPTSENSDASLVRSEAFQASLRTRLSAKKFVAYAWCSWCFRRTVHGRAQRNLLRRSRYKCTECAQTTLKCRTHCGAMARGHPDYDEELCARCDGTLGDWGEERPSKRGYCSMCFHQSTHHLIHRGYVLHDTYRCGYCKAPTFLCATCQTNFGAFGSHLVLISELLHYTCARCGDHISSWEDLDPALRQLGSGDLASSAAPSRKPPLRYQHPFESFAEVRAQVACEALVDGEEFFARSHQWISEAKDTIFLSCWWLAPFVHLLRRRGEPLDDASRLCDLLWARADAGVRVYVIIWHNSMFLSLCSEEAKQLLEANHPNIHVMRHPSYTLPSFMWTHHQKFLAIDYSRAIVGGFDYAVGRFDTPQHRLTDLGVPSHLRPPSPGPRVPPEDGGDLQLSDADALARIRGMGEALAFLRLQREGTTYDPHYLWPGIDYYQPQDARPENYHTPHLPIVDRLRRCRMPWHDVSVALDGLAAYDVCANFVERWNHHRRNHPFDGAPQLGLPKPPAAGRARAASTCEVQVVRSLGAWSGLRGRTTEASVYGAYLSAIGRAQHYIYIENQYVVSSTAGGGVENRIVAAILERVRLAIRQRRTFRVFVMFPIPEETGRPANHMLQLSYQTLFRGGFSLLDQLRLEFPGTDPFEYVGFYFLRTHGTLVGGAAPGQPEFRCVTDMVFVHSKVMLVDDEVAIVASNNLNDRSMVGDRDSELGVVILDAARVPMRMDGAAFEGRKFAHELRVRLWREHLGLVGARYDHHPWVLRLAEDPIGAPVYHGIWRRVAERNTRIYREVFPHIPSNAFATFQAWEQFALDVRSGRLESPVLERLPHLAQVQGHLCFHPTRFCHQDSLDWAILEDMVGNELPLGLAGLPAGTGAAPILVSQAGWGSVAKMTPLKQLCRSVCTLPNHLKTTNSVGARLR